jgi:hypothetical protein
MTVVDNNLFESLPLDAMELIPSFLNDKELLRDSMTILMSCQMMLKASEGLCEKIYQQLLAGVAGTNRGSFERRVQFQAGRHLANSFIKLHYRHLLQVAQRTILRQVIWEDPENDSDDGSDEDDDEDSSIDALVLSPSHNKFVILADGLSNGRGYMQVMDTSTLTTLIPRLHEWNDVAG